MIASERLFWVLLSSVDLAWLPKHPMTHERHLPFCPSHSLYFLLSHSPSYHSQLTTQTPKRNFSTKTHFPPPHRFLNTPLLFLIPHYIFCTLVISHVIFSLGPATLSLTQYPTPLSLHKWLTSHLPAAAAARRREPLLSLSLARSLSTPHLLSLKTVPRAAATPEKNESQNFSEKEAGKKEVKDDLGAFS